MRTETIDRDSPVPIYYQIETDLRKRILRREWEPNQKLPTEAELAREYDVSRLTLRQALAELEKDRIIKKQRGRGTVVNGLPEPFVNDLSFTLISGYRIKQQPGLASKVLDQRIVTNLPANIREKLKLDPSDSVIYIKRLILYEGKPLAAAHSWLPAELVPDFESVPLMNDSFSLTLSERYQLQAVLVEDYLEVVQATKADCELLSCVFDSPLVLMRGISFLEGARPLEYSHTLFSAASVRFRFTMRVDCTAGFVLEP